jgi:hypothetical protein
VSPCSPPGAFQADGPRAEFDEAVAAAGGLDALTLKVNPAKPAAAAGGKCLRPSPSIADKDADMANGKNFDEEVARKIRELEELQYGKGKGPAKDADGET